MMVDFDEGIIATDGEYEGTAYYFYEEFLSDEHIVSDNYIEHEFRELHKEWHSIYEDEINQLYNKVIEDENEWMEMPGEQWTDILRQENELYYLDEQDIEEDIKDLEPIDYMEQHKKQIEIGQKGEDYVYNYERKKLEGTPYYNKVNKDKANDPSNGYDILSYEKNGDTLYIEVKATTQNNKQSEFELSINQIQTAQRMQGLGKKYIIYHVKNIYSDNPKLTIIDDFLDEEKYKREPTSFKLTKIMSE